MDWPFRPAFTPSKDHAPKWLWGNPDNAAWLGTPQPLTFLAQVNLADVATSVSHPTGLPPTGMLWFFYDLVYQGWGFDPADAPGFRVLYAPEPANLAPRQPPATIPALQGFASVPLRPNKGFDLPWVDNYFLEQLGLTDAMIDAYRDTMWSNAPAPAHKMGGYANPIQSAMEAKCALVTAGLSCGDPKVWHSDAGKEILGQPNDWTLLFQIDEDVDAGMQWVDMGRLYFWIRAADLRAANFDRPWVILQTS